MSYEKKYLSLSEAFDLVAETIGVEYALLEMLRDGQVVATGLIHLPFEASQWGEIPREWWGDDCQILEGKNSIRCRGAGPPPAVDPRLLDDRAPLGPVHFRLAEQIQIPRTDIEALFREEDSTSVALTEESKETPSANGLAAETEASLPRDDQEEVRTARRNKNWKAVGEAIATLEDRDIKLSKFTDRALAGRLETMLKSKKNVPGNRAIRAHIGDLRKAGKIPPHE